MQVSLELANSSCLSVSPRTSSFPGTLSYQFCTWYLALWPQEGCILTMLMVKDSFC